MFTTARLALSNDKAAAGALVNLTKLIPGDTVARIVTLTNTGDIGFTYAFAASQTGNTLLWTDAANGLQVTASRGAAVLYTGDLKSMGTVADASPPSGRHRRGERRHDGARRVRRRAHHRTDPGLLGRCRDERLDDARIRWAPSPS